MALTLSDATIREPKAEIRFDGAGQVTDSVYRLDGGSMQVALGNEGIELNLLEAIPNVRAANGGYFKAAVRGDLNRWRGWIGQFVEVPAAWQVGGAASASARVRITPQLIEADSATATIKAARFQGAD